MLKVLALTPYPNLAAATRFRLSQFVEPLRRRNIDLHVSSMLDDRTFAILYEPGQRARVAAGLARGTCRRVADLRGARGTDVVLVQREALLFGPPVVEWLVNRWAGRPIVLDLDDPTWVGYDSPTYGKLGRWLKWPGKGDQLIRMAALVTCGNDVIREHVAELGKRAVVVPPVVDTDRFRPASDDGGGVPVIGWIGSHSTQPYLEAVVEVLEGLARQRKFRLRLVGTRGVRTSIVDACAAPWTLDREVADFQGLDIGLYPLPRDEWATAKAGLKAVQYMAVGRPFVVSAGSAPARLGLPGTTHFVAATPAEWSERLETLLDDRALRARMGAAGRRHVLAHHTIDRAADTLADALQEAASAPA